MPRNIPYRPVSREAIGKRLRAARLTAGHRTVKSASDLLGMHRLYLTKLETGDRTPAFETLHRMVLVLGLDTSTLFAPAEDHEVQDQTTADAS